MSKQTYSLVWPADLIPVHAPWDIARLAVITESMILQGWHGAPLVADDRQALTGSHRLAAAEEVGIYVPVVQICDLMAEHGYSWHDLKACFEESDDDWYEAGCRLGLYLPYEIMDYYGIDLC